MEWNHSTCQDPPLPEPKDNLLAEEENNLLFLNPLDTSLTKCPALWNKSNDQAKSNFKRLSAK